MTLDAADKRALSDVRMAKAREFLADARAVLLDRRLRTAVNRAYYAALNALRAVLILEGANPETHEGVLTLLSLRFVKTDLLPAGIARKFKALLSRRTDVDYGDFDSIDEAEARASIETAGEIVERVDELRTRLMSESG